MNKRILLILPCELMQLSFRYYVPILLSGIPRGSIQEPTIYGSSSDGNRDVHARDSFACIIGETNRLLFQVA